MTDYNSLLDLFQKYVDLFECLTENQEKKLQAVKAHNNDMLNECMKTEQADTLVLRGHDKKREQLLEKLSLSDLTFQQLIPKLPEEYQADFTLMLRKLASSFEAYKVSADCAKQMIELDIYRLSGVIEELKKKTNTSAADVYTPDGSVNPENLSFRDIKI